MHPCLYSFNKNVCFKKSTFSPTSNSTFLKDSRFKIEITEMKKEEIHSCFYLNGTVFERKLLTRIRKKKNSNERKTSFA